MQSFINGNYTKAHLNRFLVNILPVYQVVEQRLIQNDIIGNPDLERSPFIKKDINALINDNNFVYPEIEEVTKKYIAYIWQKPLELLKAELYVRWLADFYGGRMLTKSLDPYNNMYKSENPSAVIGAVRQILDREVTTGTASDEEIIDEAKKFFSFHIELFDIIYHG
jgi:heme oxygenase